MNQTGETKTFVLSASSGSQIYAYVWKFWDGTSEATVYPTVQKVLNIGGNPVDDRSLYYTCSPVAVNGHEVVVNGSLQVNNPPSIVPSPSISTNDTYLPFNTRLQLDAFHVDQLLGNQPLQFDWYLGASALGNGTLGASYPYKGTWSGNDTVVVNAAGTAQPCFYDTTVYSNRVIRCYVQDNSGGIAFVDFDLRGYTRPALETGIVASTGNLGAGASALPVKRIGYGEYFEFVVEARDAGNAVLNFSWNCAGSNNWTVPSTGAGAVTQNPDGSWRSVFLKDLSGEVVSSGTEKTATAVCAIISPSARTDVSAAVVLVKNSGPTAVAVTVFDAVGNGAITSHQSAGVKIRYEAVVTDPDGDIGYVYWTFVATTGTPWPNPTRMVGPKVVVDTGSWTGCAGVVGSWVAVDRLLQPSLSGTVPYVTFS